MVKISQRFSFILYHHGSKLPTSLRVYPHQIPEKKDVVWRVAYFLGIQDNLLELTCLSKALDNLERNV